MNLYTLENLAREFKGRKILDIEELAIKPGKIYTLIGPNGAGKSTLLNVLAFLDRPEHGALSFKGERVEYSARQLLELRRRVVLLDQYPILFTGPVWKNVEFGLKVRGVDKAERRKRVVEVLDLVGMEKFIEADAHKLSGGETKRVALARALAVRPEVLLCDEPGANVDKENQEIILALLGKINKSYGTSVIFSTHYLSQGRRLADHSLMLEHGQLSDMVNENIFRARVIAEEHGRLLCQVGHGAELTLPKESVADSSGDFKLYIDPTKTTAELDCAEPAANIVAGTVFQLNQDKGRIHVGVDIGVKLFFFLTTDQYRDIMPIIGGRIMISIPDSAMRCSMM
ncbi:energy-coupling factor ABC transporter ATP-binding protein [Desulfosediminicola ganghwensis]|uniref:energy-coupling factor ABC transporter ATP-binding protein n=1 Tax=Desulfosediminicola ganghwensis TaxID=2569540 RepID=UPI0010AC9DC7|nr:ATP-binding cassette domain-containing protein [Desulfosediminicola ganghwensis]